MALSQYALISLIEAKEYLGLPDEGRLERVTALINAATDYCEGKTGDKLLSRAWVEEVDGQGQRDVYLAHNPITKVTLVEYLQDYTLNTWQPVDANQYPAFILQPGRRRVGFRNLWLFRGMRNWRFTYTAGYNDADNVAPLPALLKEAALQVLQTLYAHFDRHKGDIQSIQVGTRGGGSSASYLDQALPRTTLDIFARYAVARA